MTQEEQNHKSPKPPYVSWETFQRVLNRINRRTPCRLDMPVLEEWEVSEATSKKVLPALRFLGLINDEGEPNKEVWNAITQSPEKYKAAMAKITRTAYGGLFERLRNVEQASLDELSDAFGEFYHVAKTSRQAVVAFFVGMAAEGGIELAATAGSQPKRKQVAATRPQGRQPGRAGLTTAKTHRPGTPTPALAPFLVAIQVTGAETEDELEERFERVRKVYAKVFHVAE